MSEEKLVNELKDGSDNAFQKLVEKYQNMVVNTCFRFVLNKEDAEDIAQDVFIKIHKSISGFRDKSQLSTWIYRISITKSLDFIRRKKRKKRIGDFIGIFGINSQVEQIAAPQSANPDKCFEENERLRIIHQAINTLPDSQKVAFTLSKLDGMNYKEIAKIMETTLSSVESLIHRAKKNLQKKLHHHYENNTPPE